MVIEPVDLSNSSTMLGVERHRSASEYHLSQENAHSKTSTVCVLIGCIRASSVLLLPSLEALCSVKAPHAC